MARRTRSRRNLGAAALTALATGAALLSVPVQAHAEAAVTVTPDPSYQQQKFEGWGTSLVWFANATGDYPRRSARSSPSCSSATTASR